jgi:hypothetical protein
VGGRIGPSSATGQGQPRLPHWSLIVIDLAVPPPSGCRAAATHCTRRHKCTCCSLTVAAQSTVKSHRRRRTRDLHPL